MDPKEKKTKQEEELKVDDIRIPLKDSRKTKKQLKQPNR